MNNYPTPIVDFIKAYAENGTSRFHMPGHKGKSLLGFEAYDITEIAGADVLYAPDGIIRESEEHATSLFQTAHSFYSTEGSTLAIKAMLMLALSASPHQKKTVLAARNVHKAFVYAAAWLDFEIKWLYSEENSHLCACKVTKEAVKKALSDSESGISAVYLTSPDYLGNLVDIKGIAEVCREQNIPLLVDNAHGAYLAFDEKPKHPILLGATMTADSAHKTLPVLTGGAYLHVSKEADPYYLENARAALSAFASTSPSYLTLASLDQANRYLAEEFSQKYKVCLSRIDRLTALLDQKSLPYLRGEPLKLTIEAFRTSLSGERLAEHLRKEKIEVEFYDHDCLVLMFSPENTEDDFARLEKAIASLDLAENGRVADPPAFLKPVAVMTPREAILSRARVIPVEEAEGCIAASPTVSCPPAIPIVVSGERITKEAIALFLHYGIKTVSVVRN